MNHTGFLYPSAQPGPGKNNVDSQNIPALFPVPSFGGAASSTSVQTGTRAVDHQHPLSSLNVDAAVFHPEIFEQQSDGSMPNLLFLEPGAEQNPRDWLTLFNTHQNAHAGWVAGGGAGAGAGVTGAARLGKGKRVRWAARLEVVREIPAVGAGRKVVREIPAVGTGRKWSGTCAVGSGPIDWNGTEPRQ